MDNSTNPLRLILLAALIIGLTAIPVFAGSAVHKNADQRNTVELSTSAAPDSIPLPVYALPNRASTSELKVRGRIQGQFAASRGGGENHISDGESYSSFDLRRVRLGVQGKLYGDFNFVIEANVLAVADLDVAMITYTALSHANISLGKNKPHFGLEQVTSSAEILTFERSRLDGHLNAGKPLGFRIHGNMKALSYDLGIYNGETSGPERMSESVYLFNASATLNLDDQLIDGLDTKLRGDYIHRTKNTGYYPFHDAFALSAHLGTGEVDVRAEFMSGTGDETPTISGFYVMPSYYLHENLQAVLRYENVSGDTGISLGHNRYADRVPDIYLGGNNYEALYLGLNYYIHEHNLKLMLGYELAQNSNGPMNQTGTVSTVFSGIRLQI